MATVQRIDGTFARAVEITNIEHVGDEGSRRGAAHIDGKQIPVYNSIVDGFNSIWVEQMTWEEYQEHKAEKGSGQ